MAVYVFGLHNTFAPQYNTTLSPEAAERRLRWLLSHCDVTQEVLAHQGKDTNCMYDWV